MCRDLYYIFFPIIVGLYINFKSTTISLLLMFFQGLPVFTLKPDIVNKQLNRIGKYFCRTQVIVDAEKKVVSNEKFHTFFYIKIQLLNGSCILNLAHCIFCSFFVIFPPFSPCSILKDIRTSNA